MSYSHPKSRSFLFFPLFTIFLFAFGQPNIETPENVLKKVKLNYDRHSSISYKINYRQKFFSSDDTIEIQANCKLKREKSDTLFGGYIWYRIENFEIYYDLVNIYQVNHSKKKIIEYKSNENKRSVITGNTAGNIIDVGFISPGKLFSDLEDPKNTVTIVSDKSHFIVTIKYADREPFSELEKNVWINTRDFKIEKITDKAKFQDNCQYKEWNLFEISFDNMSVNDLESGIKMYKQSYVLEQHKSRTEKEIAPLEAGVTAPYLEGLDFHTGRKISLDQFRGKIVILDFSYMACLPCIKAIPHLNQIQNEFKDQNVAVMAINSKDNQEENKKRLSDFIQKNSISYPMLMTTNRTDSLYKVKSYPTLYAIDKTGKIIFTHVGYSDRLSDTLRDVINNYK